MLYQSIFKKPKLGSFVKALMAWEHLLCGRPTNDANVSYE